MFKVWIISTLAIAAPAMLSAQESLVPDRAPPTLGGVAFGLSAGTLDGAEPTRAIEEATADDGRRMVLTVLSRNDCRIAERDVERVFAPEGLSFDTVSTTLADLYVEGVVRLDHTGTMMLPAEICPPSQLSETPRDRVLALFAENGCEADEDTLLADETIAALSETQRLAVLGEMEASGALEVGTFRARLNAPLCTAR